MEEKEKTEDGPVVIDHNAGGNTLPAPHDMLLPAKEASSPTPTSPVTAPITVPPVAAVTPTPAMPEPAPQIPVSIPVPQKEVPPQPKIVQPFESITLPEGTFKEKPVATPIPQTLKGAPDPVSPTPSVDKNLREIGVGGGKPEKQIPTVGPTDGLPRIRTYAADMGEEIKKRGATLTTIVGAEREKNARELAESGVEQTPPRKIARATLLLLATVVLLALGAGAIFGVMYLIQPSDVAPPKMSIVSPNDTSEISIQENVSFLAQVTAVRKNRTPSLGEVEEIVIKKDGVLLSSEEVLTLFGAPSALARNSTDIMVGIHAFDRNQPFIIAEVSVFDRAFDAMLSWENTIGDTLGSLYTPTNKSGRAPELTFVDKVVKNIDVRQSQDEWKILYAFPRPNLLVITTNEATLREIITRLSQTSTR